MDGLDALVETCDRLRRLAGNAETALEHLRARAALRLAVVVSMFITALLGCVVALALTWDGPYRLVTAMLLWGGFAVGTLYLRARIERGERAGQSRSELVQWAQTGWAPRARGAREARPLRDRLISTTKLIA
jgi:hypothetical protein